MLTGAHSDVVLLCLPRRCSVAMITVGACGPFQYRKGGDGAEREFVTWSFAAEDGLLLFINQRGDRDFSAYAGSAVEEYQFTDILPAGGEG